MKVASEKSSPSLPLLQPFALRDFRLLFFGHCGSIIGDQFYLLALPWLIYSITDSNLMLGSVLLVSGATRSAFLLMGGALSDRFLPRVTMLMAYALGALVTVLTTIVVHFHLTRSWHLFVLGGCFGIVEATFMPAYQSLTPMIIRREQLVASNSLLRSAVRLMGIIGPLIAGIAIAKTGFTVAFAIDAASFIFAFVMIRLIRIRPVDDTVDGSTTVTPPPRQPMLKSIAEGLQYVVRNQSLRALLAYMVVFEFALVGVSHVGVPAFARLHFGQDDGSSAFGILTAFFAAGVMVGMVLAGSLNAFKRENRVTTLMTILVACALIALAFTTTLPAACVALFACGVGSGAISIIIQARVQMSSEKRMLGRVISIIMLGVSLAEMVAYGLCGVLADWDLRYVFLLSGFMMGIATLVWLYNQKRQPST